MVYIVVYKEGGDRSVESISLNQFVFNRDNFLDAITQNSPGRKLVILEGMNFEQSMATLKQTTGWPERYELLTQTAGYTKKTKAKDDYSAMMQRLMNKHFNIRCIF